MTQLMFLTVALMVGVSPSSAWDGIDANSGQSVEIGEGNLVRTGRDIEIYDYEAGEYRDVTVEDINRYGSSVEIEVYDHDTGEYRTFEMDGD